MKTSQNLVFIAAAMMTILLAGCEKPVIDQAKLSFDPATGQFVSEGEPFSGLVVKYQGEYKHFSVELQDGRPSGKLTKFYEPDGEKQAVYSEADVVQAAGIISLDYKKAPLDEIFSPNVPRKYIDDAKLHILAHKPYVVLDGTKVEFYKDGSMKRKGSYLLGSEDGLHEVWNKQGVLTESSEWINGKRVGKSQKWNSEKELVSNYEYNSSGEIHGEILENCDDGSPKLRAQYSNGEREGSYRTWSCEDGQLEREGAYREGLNVGPYLDRQAGRVLQGSYSETEPGRKIGRWQIGDHQIDYDTESFQSNEYLKVFSKFGGFTGRDEDFNLHKGNWPDLETYIDQGYIDPGKPIATSRGSETLEGSDKRVSYIKSWTYPVILVADDVYTQLVSRGVDPTVVDSKGENRLRKCMKVKDTCSGFACMRESVKRCSVPQMASYSKHVQFSDESSAVFWGDLFTNWEMKPTSSYMIKPSSEAIAQAEEQQGALVDVVKNLVDYHNLKVNVLVGKSGTEAPLQRSMLNRNWQVLYKYLIEVALVDQKNKSGATALHVLLKNGNRGDLPEVIKVKGEELVARGANLQSPLSDGSTMKDVAFKSGNLELVKYIDYLETVKKLNSPKPTLEEEDIPSEGNSSMETSTDVVGGGESKPMQAQTNLALPETLPVQQADTEEVIDFVGSVAKEEDENQVSEVVSKKEEATILADDNNSPTKGAATVNSEDVYKSALQNIKEYNLSKPANNNATEKMHRLRSMNGGRRYADIVSEEIADAYIALARSALSKGDINKADRYLAAAGDYNLTASASRKSVSMKAELVAIAQPEEADIDCMPNISAKGIPFIGTTYTLKQSFEGLSYDRAYDRLFASVKNHDQYVGVTGSKQDGLVAFSSPASKSSDITVEVEFHSVPTKTAIDMSIKVPLGVLMKKSSATDLYCDVVGNM